MPLADVYHQEKPSLELAASGAIIPPYGRRRNFVPRKAADFGDGGAYPEIPVAQYPLDMGRSSSHGSKTLAVSTDASGQVTHDALVKQGANKDRIVHTGGLTRPSHSSHLLDLTFILSRSWLLGAQAGENECSSLGST